MFLSATKTIGVLTRSEDGKDSHGNPVPSWAEAVPVSVFGWGPRSADGQAEPLKPGRDEVVIGLTVYGPAALVGQVTPADRVEVPLGGLLYEVDGEIGDWCNGPFGWAPGVSVTLRRVEG